MNLGLSLSLTSAALRQGGGYDPFTDTDVLDYWDAERAVDFTLSGGAVTAWASAKNAYSASQAGVNAQPVYASNGLNGRPVVTGDGVDDELTYSGAGNFPTGGAAGEIWLLVDQKSLVADTGNKNLLSYGGASATVNARVVRRAVVSGVNRASVVVGNGTTAVTLNGSIVDFSGVHIVRAIVTGTSVALEVDGVSEGSAAVVPSTNATRLRLFASSGSTAGAFSLAGLNFAALTAPLSTAKAAQMLAYLKSRGGIA